MSHNASVSVADLVNSGVSAYKNKHFKEATAYLLRATDMEPRNWRAKLYLGMCYYYQGDILLAANQFRFLQGNCIDAEIRQRAETALAAINAQLRDKRPELSQSFPKPILPPPKPAVKDEALEWIPSESL